VRSHRGGAFLASEHSRVLGKYVGVVRRAIQVDHEPRGRGREWRNAEAPAERARYFERTVVEPAMRIEHSRGACE
jgi:hypothetical protein